MASINANGSTICDRTDKNPEDCLPLPEDANAESKEIQKPLSYLIFDTETTGLPGTYGNPRITELCLLGVHRDDMMEDGVGIPRVVNKLQLCINPRKRVTPGSSMITGLFNDALERQQPFERDIIAIIRGFIQTQAQPTCLIAHNGIKFDFPLLMSELMKAEEELPQNLLCADSLLAFRELDADPEALIPPAVVREDTWEDTEVTPVKRASPGQDHELGLPKKPRKDPWSESLVENIQRAKVAKKLQYTDQHEYIKSEQHGGNTGLSGSNSNPGPFEPSFYPLSNSNAQTNVNQETEQGQSQAENNTEQTSDGFSSHHSAVGCFFQTESDVSHDVNNESRRHDLVPTLAPSSQGSLLDDEFLMAVSQIESRNNLSAVHQNQSSACPKGPLTSSKIFSESCVIEISSAAPGSPNTELVTTPNIPASPVNMNMMNVNAATDTANAQPETITASTMNVTPVQDVVKASPETLNVSVHNLTPSADGVSAGPNTAITSIMNVSVPSKIVSESGQTVTKSHETASVKESSDFLSSSAITAPASVSTGSSDNGTSFGGATEICSADRGGKPRLTSEATVIYTYEPRAEETVTFTELNSQGSLPDCDFLEAVQNMERLQDSKKNSDAAQCVSKTEQDDKVKDIDIYAKNNNSSQIVCIASTANTASSSGSENSKSCMKEKVGNGSELLPNRCEMPAKEPQTPSGGKRRSFRLPDLYRRHFGRLPTTSHTAEDDCNSLLRVMKKFSPRFLDWVDENCLPFRTVKPMY